MKERRIIITSFNMLLMRSKETFIVSMRFLGAEKSLRVCNVNLNPKP